MFEARTMGLCLFYSNTCPCTDLDDGSLKKSLGKKSGSWQIFILTKKKSRDSRVKNVSGCWIRKKNPCGKK
jgi:hypothetical protein